MSEVKITDLTAAASAADSDVLVIVDVANDTTKKITKGNLVAGLGGSGGLDSAGVQSVLDGLQTVSIGVNANAATGTVAIGDTATVVANGVAIGHDAYAYQYGVAIGHDAHQGWNGHRAVVIGYGAGSNNTGFDAVAIGYQAGGGVSSGSYPSQRHRNVYVGGSAGANRPALYGVAIGWEAGETRHGTSSVAIGAMAGKTDQGDNNIIVNATGAALDRTDNFGIDIRTSDSGSVTYSTDSDWQFGASVTAPEFKFSDGTSMTTAPTGGGGGGLDSAAVRAMMLDSVSTSSLTISETVDSGQTAVLTFDSDNNALFSGSVTASSFIGDGSQLTGISAGSSGLDSAAVNAMIDSDFNDPEVLTFGTNSTVITIGRTAANHTGVAIGNQADASGGLYNVAIGTSAKADTQVGTTAIGHNAKAQGTFSSAYGRDTNASAQYGLALGYGAQATGSNAKGIGGNATGNYSVAVGSTASGVGTISMGYSASAAGTSSVALGNDATTASNAQYGIAIGKNAGADTSQTIHINATGQTTNQPQTAYGIAIETSPYGSLTYDTTNDWTFGAGVTMTDLTASGATVVFSNLPTADPVNAGQLWNDNGTLKISAG